MFIASAPEGQSWIYKSKLYLTKVNYRDKAFGDEKKVYLEVLLCTVRLYKDASPYPVFPCILRFALRFQSS